MPKASHPNRSRAKAAKDVNAATSPRPPQAKQAGVRDVRHHLDRDIRQARYTDQVSQLRSHDARRPDAAAQRGLVH